MNASTETFAEPEPELRHRQIGGRDARVAVFKRTYDAAIEEVWNACTNPDRLRRWYVPITGDLRVGGTFQQAPMGAGVIERCEPPRALKLSLGGGADEIELHLSERGDGMTALELQHATTVDEHRVGGQMFDAVFCMGGGYYPRLLALHRHLTGILPDDYDPLRFHELPRMQPVIDRGSAAMAALLEAHSARAAGSDDGSPTDKEARRDPTNGPCPPLRKSHRNPEIGDSPNGDEARSGTAARD